MKFFSMFLLLGVFSLTFLNNCKSEETKNVDRPQYKIKVVSQGETWGEITLETFPDVAPLHAANFDSLVVNKAYDGCAFHRVIPGFVSYSKANTQTRNKNYNLSAEHHK